jgi:hypothetical protein
MITMLVAHMGVVGGSTVRQQLGKQVRASSNDCAPARIPFPNG